MAQHGGKRPGAGRKPGAVSKAKRELAAIAKEHAEDALAVLVEIMRNGENEAARISAANAVLDRGYGKPMQAMTHGGDPDNPLPAAIGLVFVKPDEND